MTKQALAQVFIQLDTIHTVLGDIAEQLQCYDDSDTMAEFAEQIRQQSGFVIQAKQELSLLAGDFLGTPTTKATPIAVNQYVLRVPSLGIRRTFDSYRHAISLAELIAKDYPATPIYIEQTGIEQASIEQASIGQAGLTQEQFNPMQ